MEAWKWLDKVGSSSLTGPIGVIATIFCLPRRLECIIVFPNSRKVRSIMLNQEEGLDSAKKQVCRIVRKMMVDCHKQLKMI